MRGNARRIWWKRFMSTLLVLGIVAFFGIVFGVRRFYTLNLRPLNTAQSTVPFTIESGAPLRETASKLKKESIIRSAWAFERYVQNNQGADKIKAGTYELSASYNVSQIVSIITEGKVATNLVTILPGKRLDQVKKSFLVAGFSQVDVDAAFEPSQYSGHPALVDKPPDASLEGYLYPESFQRTSETKPKEIITASLNEMQKRLSPEIREAFSRQGLSVFKAVTLASIVEREVPNTHADDQTQVAQVFLSRLADDRLLESDATAGYGAYLDNAAKDLSYGDLLKYVSPYNTYLNKGLPPGPISNVTQSSLHAVAYPAQTDWLYFVAGDDGTTYFSHTIEEHQALTAAHCKRLCN